MPNLTIKGNHRVRKDVSDVLIRTYFATKGEAIHLIDEALQKHHMTLDVFDCPGDEGRTYVRILALKGFKYLCDSCTEDVENPAFDNTMTFAWYRMPSGRYEITGYIS